MLFHFSALTARKILDAAPRGFEGFVNDKLQIGVCRPGRCRARGSTFSISVNPVRCGGLALDDDFLSGQGQVDANVEGFAFLVMAVRELNGHAARHDAVVERFEFLGLFANPVFYLGGMFHVAKSDLQWKRHGPLP